MTKCYCSCKSQVIYVSMIIPINEENDDLPTLYWIPKLNKNPYRERYITDYSTCLWTVCDYNKKLFSSHDKYVVVPVDKTSSNIVFIYKHYYCGYSIKEYGISKNSSIPTSFDKDDIAA